MDWAENQHFNYLRQVLDKINESQEDREEREHGTPVTSDADILRSMGF